MFTIRADERCLQGEADPRAEQAFEVGFAVLRRGAVETARALLRVHESGSHLRSGAASAVDWAVGRGMDRRQARELLDLGRALAAEPEIESAIERREVTPQAMAKTGVLLRQPGRVAPTESLIDFARGKSAWQLDRDIRERVEGAAQQDRVVSLHLSVRESVRTAFRRARDIASRRAQTVLTNGQTFAVITADYLKRFDVLEQTPGTRRVGDTAARPDSRYVPVAVEREVRRRAGGRCEIPGCSNRIFLELMHLMAHRDGGSREAENLLLGCTTHHTMVDAGEIEVVSGPADGLAVRMPSGEIVTSDEAPERGADADSAGPPPPASSGGASAVREPTPPYGRRGTDRRPRSSGDAPMRSRPAARAPPVTRMA